MSTDHNASTDHSPLDRPGSKMERTPGRRSAAEKSNASGHLPDRPPKDGSQLNITTEFRPEPIPALSLYEMDYGNHPLPMETTHEHRASKDLTTGKNALQCKPTNTRAPGPAVSPASGTNTADDAVNNTDAAPSFIASLSNTEKADGSFILDDSAFGYAPSDLSASMHTLDEEDLAMMNRHNRLPVSESQDTESWNLANTPSRFIGCSHGSIVSSPGGTLRLCRCDHNIVNLTQCMDEIINFDNGNVRRGDYKAAMARFLAVVQGNTTAMTGTETSSKKSNGSSASQGRKRKCSIPLNFSSSPKKMVFETSSGTSLPTTRKRSSSSDDEDESPAKKRTCLSFTDVITVSYPPLNNQSASRKRQCSSLPDDHSPSKKFLTSTPITSSTSGNHRFFANSPEVSPISSIPTASSPKAPRSEADETDAGIFPDQSLPNNILDEVSVASSASGSDDSTEREATSPPPAHLPAPLPLPQPILPPLQPVPPQLPRHRLVAYQNLKGQIALDLSLIAKSLRSITKDTCPRKDPAVLEFVLQFQRQRTTLRRLEIELTTPDVRKQKPVPVVQTNFEKIHRKLQASISGYHRVVQRHWDD